MPRDQKPEPFAFSSLTPWDGTHKADLPGAPEACPTMSEWSGGWAPPKAFGPLDLLEVCPAAPAYFAEAAHLTVRDLRTVMKLLSLNADLRKPETIYRAILERVKSAPWAFAVLETILADKRLDPRIPQNRRRSKVEQLLHKLPLSKLRLVSQPHLQARLSELAAVPVAPDLAVAIFCEYAITFYQSLTNNYAAGDVDLIRSAMKILAPEGSLDLAEKTLGSLDDVQDWLEHGTLVIAVMREYPDVASVAIQEHVVRTLREVANLLEADARPELFSLLSHLASIGIEQAAQVHVSRRDAVIAELGKLGIPHDPEAIDEVAVASLSAALDDGLAETLHGLDMTAAQAKEAVDDLSEQIRTASQDEDFVLVGQIAPQASAAKDALARSQAAYDRLFAFVASIASGEDVDREPMIDALRAIVSDAPSPKKDALVDAEGLLTPTLFATAAEYGAGPADDMEATGAAAGGDAPAAAAAETLLDPAAVAGTKGLAAIAPVDPAMPVDDEVASGPGSEPDEIEMPDSETGSVFPAPLFRASEPAQSLPDRASAHASRSEASPDGVRPSPGARANPAAAVWLHPAKGLERNSGPADPSAADIEPAVPVEVLADLVDRNLVGVAADLAEAFEAHGQGWPITAAAIRVAAGSRASHREYGLDTQRFLSVANSAMGDDLDDLSSVLVLGALIRPAVLENPTGFRNALGGLCRGSLGQHLQQAIEAISELDYDFPPDADELARLSGTQRTPQRQRIAGQLREWCDTFSQKTSRWPFATAFMHHVVSPNGLIGAARDAIDAGASDAIARAQLAIAELSSQSGIESCSVKFASEITRGDVRLYPKGVEYLHRQFDEPLGLLDRWVRAVVREGSHGNRSEARLRTTIGNLQSRLEKAMQGLARESERNVDGLSRAVANWIVLQIEEALSALRGGDTGTFATLEEALTAERDLLPAAARDALGLPDLRFEVLRDLMKEEGVPAPHDALIRAREEAAFDTAFRLADRFSIDARADIRRDMVVFAETWGAEIAKRERRLKTLAKVDYKHQDEIVRRLSWCEIARARLAAIKEGSESHDLADVPAQTAALDEISRLIETNIRKDQVERIDQYRNDQNSDEADGLVSMLDELTIEAIEDRIAQLRDGRSAATFETELQGMVSEFSPGFLTMAASPGWPGSETAFREAVALEGPLFIEEDRRAAGLDFIGLYREITTSMRLRKPSVPRIREFFEDLGFERVSVQNLEQVGRTDVWQGVLHGTIQPVRSDNWFLPPVFGSQATAGYRLILVGPEVLPELVTKALTAEMPAVLLLSGVADIAKRQELAERLRAGAIPALVVDEALVAFTATHRHARARTIFECGLPYGRVEPYTTDAGSLPPEMFFGRGEEIRQIMSKTADGCLVYGGRQLGKSALLGHVARTRHRPEDDQFVIRRDVKSLGNSEKTSEIWTHLAGMLSPHVVRAESRTAEAVSRDIRAWVARKSQGRIICMFDEADHFMDADTQEDYPELSRIKELMEDTGRAFKVVFAGLHNVQRIFVQPNSPLAHLGQPICIGPLNRTDDDKRAAHDLVVGPMRAAGFRFEAREAVEEILAWANYYPSLVQEYMKGLLATLHGSGSGKAYRLPSNGPLWPISSDTLFTHRGFHHIESRIREKFHLTLNLDPRYALVAYTLGRLNAEGNEHKARVAGYRPEELLEEARIFWPKTAEAPSQAAFEALLEELFDLGVLGRVPIPQTQRHRYLLGSRQVAAMLGSGDDIYRALEAIEEKDPAVAYDRSIHRRRYYLNGMSYAHGEALYAPLTDLQIERIVDPKGDAVQIVCGLDLLGLSKVGPSLKRIAETGRLPGVPHESPVHLVSTERDLRAQVDRIRAGAGHINILVYTPENVKDAMRAITWLEHQPRVLDGQARPLILLDAADAEMRQLATRRSGQSQFLSAWGAEMVRVHLHHIEKTELDLPPLRRAVLQAAGGVPTETIKLIGDMRTATDPLGVAKNWQAVLRIPSSILEGKLGKALEIVDLDDGKEEYAVLNELMREQTGCDLVDLGPDLVATGLLASWQPNSGHIRRSALGDLVAQRIER